METHEVKAFLTLAEELHFGRTAERLGVSTGRVSQTIRKLERRIGAPLFARTSRSVALTPIGRRFRDDLAPAYQGMIDALARAVSAGRCLHVGFLGPTAANFLVDVMTTFEDSDVRIHEAQIGDMFGPLRARAVDVTLTKYPVREPDLTTGPVLLRQPRMLAMPTTSPLASRTSLSLDDVVDEVHLDIAGPAPDYWRTHHLPSTAPNGQAIRRGPAATTMLEALTLVAAGKGVCGVDRKVALHYPWPGVTFVPLVDAPPFETGLVWRNDASNGLVRTFAHAAQIHAATSREMPAGAQPNVVW